MTTSKEKLIENSILQSAIVAISELQEVKELQLEDWEGLDSGNRATTELKKDIQSLGKLKTQLKGMIGK